MSRHEVDDCKLMDNFCEELSPQTIFTLRPSPPRLTLRLTEFFLDSRRPISTEYLMTYWSLGQPMLPRASDMKDMVAKKEAEMELERTASR